MHNGVGPQSWDAHGWDAGELLGQEGLNAVGKWVHGVHQVVEGCTLWLWGRGWRWNGWQRKLVISSIPLDLLTRHKHQQQQASPL